MVGEDAAGAWFLRALAGSGDHATARGPAAVDGRSRGTFGASQRHRSHRNRCTLASGRVKNVSGDNGGGGCRGSMVLTSTRGPVGSRMGKNTRRSRREKSRDTWAEPAAPVPSQSVQVWVWESIKCGRRPWWGRMPREHGYCEHSVGPEDHVPARGPTAVDGRGRGTPGPSQRHRSHRKGCRFGCDSKKCAHAHYVST